MSDSWIEEVRGWRTNYFSVSDPSGDVPALLRQAADSLESLGSVEVLDVTFRDESTDEADLATLTVYFVFDDEDERPG